MQQQSFFASNPNIQNQQFCELLQQQQRYALAVTLPTPEVPTFDGNPVEFNSFVRAFEHLIEAKTTSDSARLYYLIQYTSGNVQELMRSCLTMAPQAGYKEARRLLKAKYGQNYKIATAYIERITNCPPIKSEDGEALQQFSIMLTSCKNTLKEIGYLNKIENPDNMHRIIEKLPFSLKQKWRDVADYITEVRKRDISIDDIATYVEKRARALNHPIFGKLSSGIRNDGRRKLSREEGRFNHRATSFGIKSEEDKIGKKEEKRPELECPLCHENHWLSQCSKFKSKSVEERFKLVRTLRLCDNCLLNGHIAQSCKRQSFCKVNGCTTKHSTFLHRKPANVDAVSTKTKEKEPDNGRTQAEGTQVHNGFINVDETQQTKKKPTSPLTGLPIVPVKVKGEGTDNVVETYAFLDGGSNTSFCTDDLLERLNVKGKKTTLSLTTLGKNRNKTNTSLASLEIYDLQEDQLVELPAVYSVAQLPVTREDIPQQSDVDRWPHLKGIVLPEINAKVELLIGNDVPKALQPIEVRESKDGGPYATRTLLGWTVNGPLNTKGNCKPTANFIRADANLHEEFERFCNQEFDDAKMDSNATLSQEDRRALRIMEDTIRLKDAHYQIALPWKKPPPSLPNNRPLAEHRLKLLGKRLEKDNELYEKYSAFIGELLKKGHAQKVPKARNDNPVGTVWYLPHHPVIHPQKPEKVRVVFDCAAKYKGTSLNDQLLQGPDLTNSLVGVLTRFREEPIAIIADVEGMFHQVRVPLEDCDALRFLWWPDNDLTKQPEEYQMMVHLFGSVSSPSCANFALRRTAEDNRRYFDVEAVNTVKRNFYVDDCLKSVRNEERAMLLAEWLRRLLAKGGFRLTKWLSNSRKVIESIPESERAESVKEICLNKLPVERALGVQWNVESDTFGFKIVVKDRPTTRRGLLSIVASVYDPLGFAAPYILPAKAVLQDLCRAKIGWDDTIPSEHLQRWLKWLEDLPKLEALKVDRCLKPKNFTDIVTAEIHHFSDASQQGYGAVSYLRTTDVNGNVHCSFVMAKSRLAPLKSITIPRLELMAAVVSTRLDKMFRTETNLPVHESVFWTDSTCVLRYIENESKRFQTFVANRITTIRNASSPSQWNYVDTKQNPADDASRGLQGDAFLNSERWLNGPEFLWQPKETWPQRPPGLERFNEDDPEEKREKRSLAINSKEPDDILQRLVVQVSSWYRLKKFVAWLLRYRSKLRQAVAKRKLGKPDGDQNTEIPPLSTSEMEDAENEIVRYVQRQNFPQEIANLKNQTMDRSDDRAPLKQRGQGQRKLGKKASPLYKLDPFLQDGVLRVGGRLRNSPISDRAKHPVILPKKHHITDLIVRHHHEKAGHSGMEYVLAIIRQQFWIIRARVAVRKVLRDCFQCKKRQAPAGRQKMADLPEDRVTPDNPPFTYVGVDCFGPFVVKRGRSHPKRYGVLFTCLSITAVHIEVAHSLDTDSFLNALRRFMARRGRPAEIRSDNGTNFVGAEKELRDAVDNWNQQKINEFLLQSQVKWLFNPPTGSHHGGVWERCIRTVRKVMSAVVKEQVLDDEGLETLMCEVEAIVNGRPLTNVSEDPNDMEALTPNHLLLLRHGPTLPPDSFRREDTYSRRRWRQAQYLADVFWRRWVKEYLPRLQERQKWLQPQRNFEVGDIVLVVDESTPRNAWPLGRVVDVMRNSKDGYVRRVSVRTKSTVLQRPVNKIVLLESIESVEAQCDQKKIR